MNSALKIAAIGAAGAALFLGSYIGFAKVVGADMHRLAIVGGFFEPPPEEEPDAEPKGSPEDEEELEQQAAAMQPAGLPKSVLKQLRTPQRAASIIDFFSVQAPFSSDELKSLSDELLASADRLALRDREQKLRDEALNERQKKLDEDFATLIRLQGSLDELASELRQREVELNRDDGIKLESQVQIHAKIGELFAKGDASELVARLEMFEAPEAAKILATLPPKRANDLLAAMESSERWLEYAEAYAAQAARTTKD